jgi:hypothetical protein
MTNKLQIKKKTKFETGGKCELNEETKVPRLKLLNMVTHCVVRIFLGWW